MTNEAGLEFEDVPSERDLLLQIAKLRYALTMAEGGLVQLLKCPDALSKKWAEEALTVIKQVGGGHKND